MKRSRKVEVPFVAAVAAALLTGCSSPSEARRCLDDFGNVLPDSYCAGTYRGGGYYGGRAIIGVPRYRYGGRMSGGRVTGWSSTPRGGFGSSGASGGGFFG